MSRKKNRSWEQQIRVDQQNSYDEFHTRQIKLKLNLKTDSDILDWLSAKQRWNSGTSMQGEIKRLIREEIAKEAAKSCRCTPTENGSALRNPSQMTDLEENPLLSRPDIQEYLMKYPDASAEEKTALVHWLEEGYSFLDNGYFLADEAGRMMDFIQGERALRDWQEATNS